MTTIKILEQLVMIKDAMDGKRSMISCQGQGVDGYTALENYNQLAEKARCLLQAKEILKREQND